MQKIPYANTTGGLVLTYANFEEIGVSMLAFKGDVLLIKPGIEWINKAKSIQKVTGFEGPCILDLTMLKKNSKDLYPIVSPYDGAKLFLSKSDLVLLLNCLQPTMVLLPKEAKKEDFDAVTSQCIYSCNDLSAGWVEDNAGIKIYNEGEHTFTLTDTPSAQSIKGIITSSEGEIDLTEVKYAQDFTLLSDTCACPTCKSQYTKAYLHHLILHTPLLCQRFLLQHQWFVHLPCA